MGLDFVQNRVYNTISHRFFGIHPVIPVKILHDLLYGLSAVISQYFGAQFLGFTDLVGLDLDIGTGCLEITTQTWLVYHDLGMWVYKTFALGTGTE